MKKWISKGFSVVAALFLAQASYAGAGALFSVSGVNDNALVATAEICLNVAGGSGISCQRYPVSLSALEITTTVSRLYKNAGIRILTPGYTVLCGTDLTSKGYCPFSVSNTSAAAFTVTADTTTTLVSSQNPSVYGTTIGLTLRSTQYSWCL